MNYKKEKKYICDHCYTEKEWGYNNNTYIVYCQNGDNFYQQFACCRECRDNLSINPIIYKCSKCKKGLSDSTAYEYRGVISCSECKDEVEKTRDYERQEIIEEENYKTKVFRGLDMGNSQIGRINRKLLKTNIEIAKTESGRLKNYENTN